MIIPTVGRVVWYHPGPNEPYFGKVQPFHAALITRVHSEVEVNLAVFDHNGSAYSRQNVPLLQEEDARPEGGYAEWMPYQKGQAAKTEALEAQLGAGGAGLTGIGGSGPKSE